MNFSSTFAARARLPISVVMPNFNHARLIPRAVAALLHQRSAPSEIIIVDDGSTDDSMRVIESLRAQSEFIKIIRHETNRGAPAALNTGLRIARGDLVYFAAADDFSLPNLFAVATDALMANPDAAFFCASAVLTNPSGSILGLRPFMWPAPRAAYLSPEDVRRSLVAEDNWAVGATVIFRRARILAAGGFEERMGSLCDGLVVRRLALEDGFYFDPTVCAAWEIYPESLSARSALSASESVRLSEKAEEHVRRTFPKDMRDRYAPLLGKRLRFSMTRLRLVLQAGAPDSKELAALLQPTAFDRAILGLLARLPFGSKGAILSWLLLRLRPFSFGALFDGWRRARTLDRRARLDIERLIREAQRPWNGG